MHLEAGNLYLKFERHCVGSGLGPSQLKAFSPIFPIKRAIFKFIREIYREQFQRIVEL